MWDIWLDRAAHIAELAGGLVTLCSMLGLWRMLRALRHAPDLLHKHEETHGPLTFKGVRHPFRPRVVNGAE